MSIVRHLTHPHIDIDVWICGWCKGSGVGTHLCLTRPSHARLEDLEWLIETCGPINRPGVAEAIAQRMHVSQQSLAKWLRRIERYDLANLFEKKRAAA